MTRFFDNRRIEGRALSLGAAVLVGRIVAGAGAIAVPAIGAGVEQAYWQLSPYVVHLTLAVDESARPGLIDDAALATEIATRVDASIGALWQFHIDVATGDERRRLSANLGQPGWDDLSAEERRCDKAFWMSVRSLRDGYEIRCREFDVYTRQCSEELRGEVRQTRMLGEQCFQLLRRLFRPLALIEPAADDEERIRLTFRGASLPRRTADEMPGAASGTVFLPLLRRTNRLGELLPDGVAPLPWTYLVLDGDDGDMTAKVESGIRRPFGVRRRGFVEQLAIALPQTSDKTSVRFHARHDANLGLSGYEVFVRNDDDAPRSLGATDSDGIVNVPEIYGPVAMLLVRSDGQLLAKAPVPVGALSSLEIPISDDPARLTAQALSGAIREKLVDLVARQAVMATRVRALIKDGKIDEAQQLMSALNNLPGASEFNLEITAARRDGDSKSKDARVQQRIDRMYSDIQSLLSRFLNRQPLAELQSEVDAAARSAQ